jgi:hypothetical protein
MIRKLPLTTLAAALAATLALSACNRADNDNAAATGDDATPAATTPADGTTPPATDGTTTTPPADANAMTITSVDLGSAVGDDNRISVPTTTFTGTDTIHASVVTDGGSEGTLVATWTFQDGQVVDTQEKVVPAGPQVTDFSITKPDGWPAGNYTLQVSKDGMVLQTREFTVG